MCWIREEVECMRVGRTVWNVLKGGGTEKREGETKILRKWGGGNLGQGVGALKRTGAGTRYELWQMEKVV